jgi:Flp pilus assembly protein TadD
VYLLQEQPDKAIDEFKRELELQPGDASALMQIAYEYLKRGDGAAALDWARQAVDAAPRNFAARRAFGQALLETGDIAGAVRELELGVKLAPDSPSMHFTLACAYQRAGRAEDADRARQEFTRLDRLARTQKSGAQAIGGK